MKKDNNKRCIERYDKVKLMVLAAFLTATFVNAQSSLRVDYTNSSNRRERTFNWWDIENKIFSGRLEREDESRVDNGGRRRRLNFIRTLGGWRTRGEQTRDFSGQLAFFRDGDYVYDPSRMINQIRQYRANGFRIHQIVLDNPPWVFQRGLTFVPDEERNDVDYLESTRILGFGNGIPPNANFRWRAFIRVVMEGLVEEFGEDVVEGWRFRIGSEIETPDHWAGTEAQFFVHYRTAAEEVRRAVPNAKVGAHFRETNFVFRRGGVPQRNYAGQVIRSFANNFVDFASANDVPYDFIGFSYYPFFNRERNLDPIEFYEEGIAPMRNNPNFDRSAAIELHEFWLYTNFLDNPNISFVDAGTSHGAAYMVKLARLAYERNIRKVHQWTYDPIGQLLSPQRMGMLLLSEIENQDRYRYTSTIDTRNANTIDAIFTRTGSGRGRRFNAIVSNYSHRPQYADENERVTVNMVLPLATDTQYEYRITTYGRDQCGFNQLKNSRARYRTNESNGGWIGDSINAIFGHTGKSIAGSGQVRRNRMADLEEDANLLTSHNEFVRSDWMPNTTRNIEGSNNRSRATINLDLESFMLQKLEIRLVNSAKEVISEKEITLDGNSAPSVEIYPNPANSNFNIALNGIENATVTITDLLGKVLYNQKVAGKTVKVDKGNVFRQGIYIVKVEGANGAIFNKKLVMK